MPAEEMNLEYFADQLMKEKDFSSVSDPDVLAQIKEDLLDSINESINAMIISEIPNEKLDELAQISENDDEMALANFISTNVPNLQEKLVQVLAQFRSSYLAS